MVIALLVPRVVVWAGHVPARQLQDNIAMVQIVHVLLAKSLTMGFAVIIPRNLSVQRVLARLELASVAEHVFVRDREPV